MSARILFITPSNIGDVLLTTPVLQTLLDRPGTPQVTVLTGPKAAELFRHDPALHEVIVYDKHAHWSGKLALWRTLRQRHFNQVVDLRRTLFPLALLGCRGLLSSGPAWQKKMGGEHAVLRHWRQAFGSYSGPEKIKFRVSIPAESRAQAAEILREQGRPWIAVAPGAASDLKRWPLEKFGEIIRRIVRGGYGNVLLLGGAENRAHVEMLKEWISCPFLDLVGKTSLPDLAAVLERSAVLISNDSGPMHLAAAVGIPVVAIFGPSDAKRYGPYGDRHKVVRLDLPCSPCGKAQCPLGTHACMRDLDVEKVWHAVQLLLRGVLPKADDEAIRSYIEITTPLRGSR